MKQLAAIGVIALFPSIASAAPLGPYSQVVFFGDSFTDGGAARSLAPNEVPPLLYPNGQLTNGDVWATQLGGTYVDGTYRFDPSTGMFTYGTGLATTNFAVGGAEAVAEPDDRSPDLGTQIDAFQASGLDLGSNSLGAILIGGNDLGEAESFPELLEIGAEVVQAIVTGAGTLLNSGLSEVAVFGMPDLGIFPNVVASGLSGIATAYTPVFNSALQAALAVNFAPDQTTYVDTRAIFDSILSDPGAYGITNTTDPCFTSLADFQGCNPEDYFFYDTVHPTEKVHEVFADAVREQFVAPIPLPASAGFLLAGLGGLLALRRRSVAA